MNSIVLLFAIIVSGLAAGEEFIVRWGLQPAMNKLPDHPHLLARQAMVRRLRIVVPFLMLPSFALSVWATVVGLSDSGSMFRILGTISLLIFVLASFLGTVPINIKVNDWDPSQPPADWKATIRRWENIDILRSTAAAVGFILLVLSLYQV